MTRNKKTKTFLGLGLIKKVILKTLLCLCLTTNLVADPLPFRPVSVITTENTLQEKLLLPGSRIVKLAKSIVITKLLVVPDNTELHTGQYGFVQGGGGAILCYGRLVVEGRHQVFFGFKEGEVRGTYGGAPITPELWECPATEKGINIALRAGIIGQSGPIVQLGPWAYFTNAPIDLRATNARLRGSGSQGSAIIATKNWAPPKWEANYICKISSPPGDSPLDTLMETGSDSASSIIWMGSELPMGGTSFFTSLEGVSIHAHAATMKYPTKWIHCVSWSGWMEEGSIIRDIFPSGFSGFGIGGDNGGVSTVNGLQISDCHIAQSSRRGSLPIYFSPHSNNHSIRNITINCGLERQSTIAAIGGPPAYIWTWPQFGVLMAGGVAELVHVEGACNAIHVYATGNGGEADIRRVDANHSVHHPMRWTLDEANRRKGVTSIEKQELEDNAGNKHGFVFHHPSVVSIGRLPVEWMAADNYDSRVNIVGARSHGYAEYLVRDWVYGIHHRTIGSSRSPNSRSGAIISYTRSDPYGLPTGEWPNLILGKYYDRKNPATDKVYFQLIP